MACNAPSSSSSSSDSASETSHSKFSIHSAGVSEVHEVPMNIIIRPFPSPLDEDKVQSLMASITAGKDVTPVDILWLQRPAGNYYYLFGSCHRWTAYTRLQRETIPAKLIPTTESVIKMHLGTSFSCK